MWRRFNGLRILRLDLAVLCAVLFGTRCLVPVRLFPAVFTAWYDVTTRSVTDLGRTVLSLVPRDPKQVDRDENRGPGTRQR